MTDWVQTDSSTNQWGREIGKGVFEFKQDEEIDDFVSRTVQLEIDLKDYTVEEIEECINSYGYSLHPFPDKTNVNIYEQYEEQANWIIAESLFEQEIL